MAENLLAVRSQVDQVAGRKSPAATKNRIRTAVIQSAATYAAPANGDTLGTALVIPAGSRILCPVTVSIAAGNASSTLSVGLRDATTKVAVDATAVVNAVGFASAATTQVNTGTKLTAGQEYYLPQDCELYCTVGGAAGSANQQFRIEVTYVSP